MATIRCPYCGSPVQVRGNRWECGWCGNFGVLSSLFPLEQAKLTRERTEPDPPLQFTISVADTTPPSRHFTYTQLEDMVRRWDFNDYKWACRDFLVASFFQIREEWAPEMLVEMDTMDLFCGMGDRDPHTAIEMMKLLLNTVGDRLQSEEIAEQLLECDLGVLIQNIDVQPILLKELERNEIMARQIFGAAYVGEEQEVLLEACDTFGKQQLKEHLLGLLKGNPRFRGFN